MEEEWRGEKDPLEIGLRSNPASVFVPLSLVYSDFGGLTPLNPHWSDGAIGARYSRR